MTLNEEKICDKAKNEQSFYPDKTEDCWQYVLFLATAGGLSLLCFIAMQAKEGQAILFFLLGVLLVYVLYIGMFMYRSPKVYIDDERTYLRLKASDKEQVIYLKDIDGYDYFVCYKKPLQYPFLSLCVQLILKDGRKTEFFAFMRGAQMVIEEKMSQLKIERKTKKM